MPKLTRVLASPGPLQPGGNPFVRLLYASLDNDIIVEDFTWKRAIFGRRYDVLHLHWPEYVIRTRSPWQHGIKLALMMILPVIVKVRKARSVWTVHNLSPHERAGSLERKILAIWTRSVATRIYLTKHGTEDDQKSVFIPHGHYLPVVNEFRKKPCDIVDVKNTILVFGILRPVKGIEDVISSVAPLLDVNTTLRIVGEPISESYGNFLSDLISAQANVVGCLKSLSDESLVSEIDAASVVLLPYKKLYNSGALLLALSCGRPVVAPQTPTTKELQSEVGSEWLQLFDPGDPTSIVAAIERVKAVHREAIPIFNGRDWQDVGRQYSVVYRRLNRS